MTKDIGSTADAMVKALGQFMWNFNGLDEGLDDTIGILLNPTDIARGEIVGAALMFKTKCRLLKALVFYVLGETAATSFESLFSKLEEVPIARNDLVHGEQWFDFEGDPCCRTGLGMNANEPLNIHDRPATYNSRRSGLAMQRKSPDGLRLGGAWRIAGV